MMYLHFRYRCEGQVIALIICNLIVVVHLVFMHILMALIVSSH